jgi:RNA polymerase sigma-70 factor (ECF subfamily)
VRGSKSTRGAGDEVALLEGLRSGEAACEERFVRDNIGRMRSVARRILRDEGLADDCVQEAFLNAFRKIGDFEGRASLKTWLHRITVNQALMKLRTLKRLAEQPIDDWLPAFDATSCRIEPPGGSPANPEEIVAQGRMRDLIRGKIDELPESYRIVLMLRDIEELDTAEVATMLEISESNVKVRLHRARSALKKLLEPLLRGERP